jgi:hypothetical protein
MHDLGKRVGEIGAFALSVLLAIIVLDVSRIIDVCWFWECKTSGEATEADRRGVQTPLSSPTQNREPTEEQLRKQDDRPNLPKGLLPQITIGPWTLNKKPDQQSGEMSHLILLANGQERLYRKARLTINTRSSLRSTLERLMSASESQTMPRWDVVENSFLLQQPIYGYLSRSGSRPG